VYSIIFS